MVMSCLGYVWNDMLGFIFENKNKQENRLRKEKKEKKTKLVICKKNFVIIKLNV